MVDSSACGVVRSVSGSLLDIPRIAKPVQILTKGDYCIDEKMPEVQHEVKSVQVQGKEIGRRGEWKLVYTATSRW